ncbi:MAG: recombination protein RecR, partial [Flavobacteriales bacterium]|nr:recombination protein RecR [Flavobacteriales bacterium]
MQIPSNAFNNAVDQLSSLPGIGKKTALRLVLHLLNRPSNDIKLFGNSFTELAEQINYCQNCFYISESTHCSICNNPSRTENIVCVVENVLDVIAIENTNQFKGKYHVLGGIISPMEGIGPSDIKINELIERVKSNQTEELIMALSTTM